MHHRRFPTARQTTRLSPMEWCCSRWALDRHDIVIILEKKPAEA